jgi:hypothetical protein
MEHHTPRHNAHLAILSGFCSGCRLEQRIHTAKNYSHVLHFQSSLHAKCHLPRPAHAFDQKHLERQTSSLVIHCRHWYRDHGTSRMGSVGKRILYNRCGLVVYWDVGLLVSRRPQALSKHSCLPQIFLAIRRPHATMSREGRRWDQSSNQDVTRKQEDSLTEDHSSSLSEPLSSSSLDASCTEEVSW